MKACFSDVFFSIQKNHPCIYMTGDFWIMNSINITGDCVKQKRNNSDKPKNIFSKIPYLPQCGAVHCELSGNREAVFEGSRGVLEYNDKSIRINTNNFVVKFCGRGLSIKCLTESSMIIEGFITSIEYIM